MRKLFLSFSLPILALCSTIPQTQSQTITSTASELPTVILSKTSTPSNEKLIDALVAAPNLYVRYVEDGAADSSVLALYENGNVNVAHPIAKEVKDVVALRDKAIPLLIEHLEDTRPTSATVLLGGYLTDKPVRVPVGFVCLDILINIIGNNKLIFVEEPSDGFGGEVKDGYYFRPDDYKVYSDGKFKERPIVRIVKATWQKAYRDGKIKYEYKVEWK